MSIHELAGKPAPRELLISVDKLCEDYLGTTPDPGVAEERVAFGTSGHRGTPGRRTFTEDHILSITQAICDYRSANGIDGPLLMGKDTHALSGVAQSTAVEVLLGNGVETRIQAEDRPTPTPVVSHAILEHNRERTTGLADGIVITPSHNPPEDGGFKYNAVNGGPADTVATSWIERRANEILEGGNGSVRRVSREGDSRHLLREVDFHGPYIAQLDQVIDMEVIREAGTRIGVDPLGGASVPLWAPIAERYGLDLVVTNDRIDGTFGFMHVDRDGKIRMDCSSPHAMAGLLELASGYEVAFGNDPDADRHGVVVPGRGLLNPNHYLAVAIDYLLATRDRWRETAGIGKTIVTSGMVDRVLGRHGRVPYEVPVGFKWFSSGLFEGSLCFGGEESAGASFLRFDGSPWSTDKDGIILCLLAAEITARTGTDPGGHYAALEAEFGAPVYRRIDAPADLEQKTRLKALSEADVHADELAGEPITAKLVDAPGNGAPIGGLKVTTEHGWFAARPSGTEDIYKIYAESFRDEDHLERLLEDAQSLVDAALG
ncbi:MAG: phosphoglucomutase (alpha-D-glucose-1,6-bisphosphate-dependent) [Planctomycetota bacterium]|nr:phosphoglucomutase (alpha-D-glucose-1,6-bisphosphate-dependent) [Planctomycetota bacterium]MED5507294.1 phosphoglucomutase (alpha-D-glucose-1,6-bisphosphate-dependent) [Planctomycetota bacterium]